MNLTQAVESLYQTFADCPRPVRIKYCRCGCTKETEVEPLLALPLRELKFSDLSNYSFSAMTTQGTVADFQYFLPRLLEGIASGEPYDYNCETLFGKLNYAKWLTWSPREISTIRAFLYALWTEALATFPLEKRPPAFIDIETVVASIAVTGEDLQTYLIQWEKLETTEANEHLVQFVTTHGRDFSREGLFRTGFWESAQPQANTLLKWLTQRVILQRVRGNVGLLRQDGFDHLFESSLLTLENISSQFH